MQQTPKYIIYIVVLSLVFFTSLGIFGTYFLILNKADPAHIALFSGFTGSFSGGLMTILSNTRLVTEPSSTTQTTTTKTDPPPEA